MKKSKVLAFVLSVCLIGALFTGCTSQNANTSPTPGTNSPVAGDPKVASSYDDVFEALSAAANSGYDYYGANISFNGAMREEMATMADGAASAPAAAPPMDGDNLTSNDKGSNYSDTNVQVDGVDEADIVKTDGEYIYVLRKNNLLIFKADGENTTLVSTVKVAESDSETADGRYVSEYASELYVSGDTAIVLLSYYSSGPYDEKPYTDGDIEGPVYDEDNTVSKAAFYDISDRANPVHKAELGQDGYLQTSRLIDGTLYLISNYYIYNWDQENDGTYVPRMYTGEERTLVGADTISIMPAPFITSSSYTVIGAYDVDAGTLKTSQSLLGGGTTVYMTDSMLYVASSTSVQTQSDPYKDSVYTVIDYTMESVTGITSFDVTDGGLTLDASGEVPGRINDQFSMDAYDGTLRLVTTTYASSWSEYIDEDKDFVNYIWDESPSANALFVLDDGLDIIGSVENLAEDEQVYSARFDGTIGYFVTFRQVDPLFAVDLSDPTNPTVLSELKITGFSEYLHLYGENRLFGLGMNADEEGRTNGMKLVMFDTTDPTDVTVKHSLALESYYSAALYNHKAILIAPAKDIIAFPTDSGYDIYGYSEADGFVKKATIGALEWSGDSRGLYIGDYAYIIDYEHLTVLDMVSFELLKTLSF